MTLTLDVPAELESGLREAARREGVALDALALDALRERAARGINGNGAAHNSIGRALALGDELAATSQAGTMNGGAKFDAAADLAALRAERFADA